jgi:carboxypeptidase C (cathepsin A)
MTATAHYHRKLAAPDMADLEKIVAESRAFALGDYTVALMKGNDLPEPDRRRIAQQLARFTGIPEQEVLRQNLRLKPWFFRKTLLSAEAKVVGRFDARVVGEDNDPGESYPTSDPSYDHIAGAFASAINAYVRGELGYESDHPYHILNSLPWKYHRFEGRYTSTASSLSAAIWANPRLRTLVLCGRRDLAVPEDSMRYSVSHLRLAQPLRAGIQFSLYESGHMMYLNAPDAEKLRHDVLQFLKSPR